MPVKFHKLFFFLTNKPDGIYLLKGLKIENISKKNSREKKLVFKCPVLSRSLNYFMFSTGQTGETGITGETFFSEFWSFRVTVYQLWVLRSGGSVRILAAAAFGSLCTNSSFLFLLP
jgi:hypothetical protein